MKEDENLTHIFIHVYKKQQDFLLMVLIIYIIYCKQYLHLLIYIYI